MTRDHHIAKRSSRNVIDVVDIQKNFRRVQKHQQKAKARQRIKGVTFASGSIIAFLLLGYAIAALSIPAWAKVIIFIFIAILGIIPGYLVSAFFH